MTFSKARKRKGEARWGRRGAAALVVALLGCSAAHSEGFSDSDAGADDASNNAEAEAPDPPNDAGARPDAKGSGGFVATDSGASDAAADDGCPAAAKLVYVTGESSQLYSFYPPTLTFKLIGTLSCLGSAPTHMTVDRQGAAWVVSSGSLYKASTQDASCTVVSTWSPRNAFYDFALTFIGTTQATDTALYMLGPSFNLATFDVASGSVATVGNVPVTSSFGDMTTDGNGALYFLMDQTSPILYKLAPATAAVVTTAPLSVTGGGSAGLAFWGGSFYVFENSTINRFDPNTKALTTLGTAPLQVTGAGQSTCVPTVPPSVN